MTVGNLVSHIKLHVKHAKRMENCHNTVERAPAQYIAEGWSMKKVYSHIKTDNHYQTIEKLSIPLETQQWIILKSK